MAARHDLGAALAGVFHEVLHGGNAARLRQRPHAVGFNQPVTDRQGLRLLRESFDETIVHTVLHIKARGEMHTWPALRNLKPDSTSAARSMSASSHTMTGAWPPNSMVVRFIICPASAANC